MPEGEELISETEETLDDLIDRLDGTVGALVLTGQEFGDHVAGLIQALSRFNLPAAVAEVPAAAQAAVSDVGNVAGEGVKTAGEAVTLPVAAAADVIEDTAGTAQSAVGTVTQGRKFSLRKARR